MNKSYKTAAVLATGATVRAAVPGNGLTYGVVEPGLVSRSGLAAGAGAG